MAKNPEVNGANVSRRGFLKKAGGAAAGVGLAASGLMFSGKPAQAAEVPKKWDKEYDVVVIGSGFAGLAAAIDAKTAGASVIVLEKMPVPGGNSIINGGLMAAAGTPLQKKEGIEDSPELMMKDTLKAGLYMNHPELARIFVDDSAAAVEWTIKLGAKYKDRVTHLGGHTVPRSYYTTNSSGAGIVRPMLKKVKEMGIPLQKKTLLENLIMDGDKGVVGVKVREKYAFPKKDSGKVVYIKAKKGVVMASGGFANDVAFRTIQDPKLDKSVDCTNHPGATAESLLEAFRCGATPVQVSWIQLGPWGCPDEKGMGIGYIFAISGAFPFGVMVDPKDGKRFVNELANRKIRADAILKTGHYAIGVADQNGVKYTAKLDKMLERGIVKKFNTLDELAAYYKIDKKGLEKTVKDYNSYVKNGDDKEFGKPLRKSAKPIATAPFYGMRLWPKAHHTMGGLQINPKAQVLDLTGEPIKGLYAAGEITGGVHGAVRLGSNATTDCIVFGRIAGQNAAKG